MSGPNFAQVNPKVPPKAFSSHPNLLLRKERSKIMHHGIQGTAAKIKKAFSNGISFEISFHGAVEFLNQRWEEGKRRHKGEKQSSHRGALRGGLFKEKQVVQGDYATDRITFQQVGHFLLLFCF
jgi:hypothetical protein